MSCGVDRRCGSDPALLWLWWRLAATAQIGSLAWEPPYTAGAALERQKEQKNHLYCTLLATKRVLTHVPHSMLC